MANLIDAIKILITGDGSGLRADLQQSEAEVEKLHEVLETPIPTTGIDGYVKNLQIMAGNVQTAEEKVQELQDRLQQPLSEEQLKALEQELQQATSGLKEAIQAYDEFGRAVANNLDDAGLKQLNEDLKATQEEINQTKAKFDELRGVSPKGGGGEEGGLFGMQGQMDTLYGGMALGAVALPMDAGIKDAIKTFGDFDQAIANVNSMAGYTPAQIDKIKQSLEDMSKTVPDGPVALANALYGIIGAGVPAADAMGVLQTASKAAAAGQTDVSTATNALIAVMNSYGMSAKDVGQISDQMFAANAAGAMTFTEFAKSVGTVAGPAAQVGVSFDQVAAATAALTNQGISAQRATMGLRALLMGIAAPTAGATKEAQKLGIQWDTNALQSKGLTGMMQEAMKATGGNTEELKKLIPNIAAWTVATDLGGKGAQSYTQAMQTMKDSVGATDKAVRAQDEGLTEQTDHMKASFQTLQIQLVQAFAPALEKVIDGVTRLINWFNNLSPQNKAWIADIALVVAGLTTLGSVALGMISGLGAMAMAFNAIKTALFGVQVAEEAVEATTVAVESTNPIGWIMLAIAGLIMLVTYIVSHWSEIKAWLIKTWTAIHDEALKIWGGITSFFSNLWNGVSSFFVNTWNSIKERTVSIWDSITGFFKKWGMDILYALPLVGIVAYVVTHWNQIKTETENIWNGIVTGIKNLWNEFTSWISNAANAVGQAVVNAFIWMYNHNYYFKDLVDFIVAYVNWFHSTWVTVWNAISTFFTNLWEGVKKYAYEAAVWMVTQIVNEWNAIQSAWHMIWDPIAKFFTGLWDTVKKKAVDEAVALSKELHDRWQAVVNAWHSIWDPIANFFSNLWGGVKTSTQTAWDAIKKYIVDHWTDIYNSIMGVGKKIGDYYANLWNEALTWGENLVHMLAQGIKNAAHEVEDEVKSIGQSIANFLGFHSPTKMGPASDSNTWAPNFVKMFAQGLSAGAPAVAAASQQLVQPLADAFGGFDSVTKDQLPQVQGLLNGIVNAKKEYQAAQKKGDDQAMADAHANADKYRAMLQQMGLDTTNFGADKTLQETMLAKSQAMTIAIKAASDLVAKQKEQVATEKDLTKYEDERNKILEKQAKEIAKVEDNSKLTEAQKQKHIEKIEAMTQKHLAMLEAAYKKHLATAEKELEKHLASNEKRYEKSEQRIEATAKRLQAAMTTAFQKMSSSVQAEVNKIIAAVQAAETAMQKLMSLQAVSGSVGSMLSASTTNNLTVHAPLTVQGHVYGNQELQTMLDQHLQQNLVPALHQALQQPSRALGK